MLDAPVGRDKYANHMHINCVLQPLPPALYDVHIAARTRGRCTHTLGAIWFFSAKTLYTTSRLMTNDFFSSAQFTRSKRPRPKMTRNTHTRIARTTYYYYIHQQGRRRRRVSVQVPYEYETRTNQIFRVVTHRLRSITIRLAYNIIHCSSRVTHCNTVYYYSNRLYRYFSC